MNLSRVSNPPKTGSIERRIKSWNIEYDFMSNQPYLSRGSNFFNSASEQCIIEYLYENITWIFSLCFIRNPFFYFLQTIPLIKYFFTIQCTNFFKYRQAWRSINCLDTSGILLVLNYFQTYFHLLGKVHSLTKKNIK